MPRFVYRGEKCKEISFPVGGMGAGCIGLDGTGRFRDWEIFNRPNKGSVNGFSHFAVKVEDGGQVLDARVLNADLQPPYMGMLSDSHENANYGFGPSRYLLSGVPHFEDSEFVGRFPFAQVNFLDGTFPGRAGLRAFNPFIPLDEENSSLPAGFYTVEIENTRERPLQYTVALSLNNPMKGARENRLERDGHGVYMVLTDDAETEDLEYGSLCMGVLDQEEISYQQYWFRGSWYDNLEIFWHDFTAPGPFKNRVYETGAHAGSVQEDVATLAVRARLEPGERRAFRFVIAWNYPNCENYWKRFPEGQKPKGWKNYYATRFPDAISCASHVLKNWDELEARTEAFARALYGSSLPDEAIEALGANLSVLKSPTVLRLEDGSFYGWEGCHCHSGCCEGSCTHVWNYAFALPFLFPRLERGMRENDFRYNQRPDGGMAFRIQLPLGSGRWDFRPCVDGEMGGVIKSYREWKISGDTQWLKTWWPRIKKSLEFAWSDQNRDQWDPDKSGVITGRQHHTLDMELFGPNSWLNSFYLAALKAASEMAQAVGEADSAQEYRAMYEKGRAFTDEKLFNGEYYHQLIDIDDPGILDRFADPADDARKTYWNEEAGEIKYQIAGGCGIDQVLGQWMSDLCGLGDVLDRGQVDSALGAIYRHNYKPSLRKHFNPCRIYGLNGEAGAVICEWPEGVRKPVVPIPYAEECMHGFEYQAASHMIGRGLVREGMDIVKSIRDRYDGEKRNPWNEFECGSNYARSMASFALLISYSGFVYDMTRGEMGFRPVSEERSQRYFWSLDCAWGEFEMDESGARLRVIEGELPIKRWVLPFAGAVKRLERGEEPVEFALDGGALAFECRPIGAGESLTAIR